MGCCFSSNAAAATGKADQNNQNPPKPQHSPLQPLIPQSQNTPPAVPEEDEEETVIKEVLVLSETPTLHCKKQQEENTQSTLPTQTEVCRSPIKKQQQQQQQRQMQETSDLSQLSEIYSITETISTSTTTTTTTATTTATKGLKEVEAKSKEKGKIKPKSTAKVIKKLPSNGEPGSVRARRVDPSPEKRARGRGRVVGEVRTAQRNVGSRSRSPGNGRGGGVDRGTVGKSLTPVTGKSVSAVTMEDQGKREGDGNGDAAEQQQPGTESLENPLVSLECFIFL